MKKIRVGIIGLGYWGPNYVRNFHKHNQSEVIWACDLSKTSLQKIQYQYPLVKTTPNYQDILNDLTIDCIAIATPPETHYKIAKDSLNSNKHVMLAKPLTTKLSGSKELLKIAKNKKLLLHGDLTYLYTASIKAIKEFLDRDLIGDILYYDSVRSNAGPIRDDASVIWDLAPHDLSIIDYLFKLKPLTVLAVGSKFHQQSTTEELAHITITYSNNFVAHIHLSWLSPVKLRTTYIAGTRKMILFDDVEMDEKIKVYDNQISIPREEITYDRPFYRSGDIIIPKLEHKEGLYVEADEIIKQIITSLIKYQNAEMNLRIIELLEACDQSLQQNRMIRLK